MDAMCSTCHGIVPPARWADKICAFFTQGLNTVRAARANIRSIAKANGSCTAAKVVAPMERARRTPAVLRAALVGGTRPHRQRHIMPVMPPVLDARSAPPLRSPSARAARWRGKPSAWRAPRGTRHWRRASVKPGTSDGQGGAACRRLRTVMMRSAPRPGRSPGSVPSRKPAAGGAALGPL